MRLNVVISAIAMLATAVSGQHTVNCWGKASHPSFNKLRYALGEVEHWVSSVGTDGNTCVDVYCKSHMSIRYCDEGGESRIMPMQNIMDSVKVIAHDCKTEYNGKTVAGGVVDHPDWWSVIVQTEDDRCQLTSPHYYGPADI